LDKHFSANSALINSLLITEIEEENYTHHKIILLEKRAQKKPNRNWASFYLLWDDG
jgi:hypothetical protein